MIRSARRAVTLLITTALLVPVADSLAQQIVYEQVSIPIGNPATSAVGLSSLIVDSSGAESISRGYDNFTLTEELNITGINWKGSYNGEFNPNDAFRGVADFSIEFLPNTTGNAPDTRNPIASFELDGGTAGRDDGTDLTSMIVPDERSSGEGGGGVGQPPAPGIVETYSADLSPFVLQPGTYWVAIQAIQTFPSPFPPQNSFDPNRWFDPSWSWALSDDEIGDNRLYSFDTLFGDRLDADGTIGPGIPLGRDLTFSLEGSPVEIGPPTPPDGDYNEDGELTVEDIDLLTAGIRTCADDCADFDLNLDGVADDDDLAFWISDLRGTLPGDANLDGSVLFQDFLILSENFTGEGGWGEGNFTTDTSVNFPDFLILSRNFGRSVSEAAAGEAASVPEPSASILAMAGLVLLSVNRRRR